MLCHQPPKPTTVLQLIRPSWTFVGLRGASWGFVGLRGASWGFVGLRGPSWGFVGSLVTSWRTKCQEKTSTWDKNNDNVKKSRKLSTSRFSCIFARKNQKLQNVVFVIELDERLKSRHGFTQKWFGAAKNNWGT